MTGVAAEDQFDAGGKLRGFSVRVPAQPQAVVEVADDEVGIDGMGLPCLRSRLIQALAAWRGARRARPARVVAHVQHSPGARPRCRQALRKMLACGLATPRSRAPIWNTALVMPMRARSAVCCW